MKKSAQILDKDVIHSILEEASYGTLALCKDNIPYSLPINFVQYKDEIYFHGAHKGKKIDMMKHNTHACLSVVEDYSLLPSYFSNDTGDACPATHLYQSVIIQGQIQFIEEYDYKAEILEALMQKLQKEGNYVPLSHERYKKAINATCLFKLIPSQIQGKFKLGQNFNAQRYERVKEHLIQRGTKKDLQTLQLLEKHAKG